MLETNCQNSDILYNYYEKTCELCKKAEEKRNKAFLIQFIIIGILFYLLLFPDNANKALSTLSIENVSINLDIGIKIISLVVCATEVYYLIRYIQLNIYIEKIYKNIHDAENQLSSMTNYNSICREGNNYLNYYPLVQTLIYNLYSYFFPIGLTLLVLIFCVMNFIQNNISLSTVLIIIASIIHSLLTILYVKFRWTNAKKNQETK